ncbi:hypothetical protein C0J52_05700 [Blattella germanica]|nr:hypothetical protein C0J52_05700 [Blattella germanica]
MESCYSDTADVNIRCRFSQVNNRPSETLHFFSESNYEKHYISHYASSDFGICIITTSNYTWQTVIDWIIMPALSSQSES